MPSLVAGLTQDGTSMSARVLPLTLLVSSIIAYVGSSTTHSLLSSAIAWLSVCTYTTLRAGGKSLWDGTPAQRTAWTAGGLLALAQVCERATAGHGLWWAKALVPLIVHLATGLGLSDHHAKNVNFDSPPASPQTQRYSPTPQGPKQPLLTLVLSGVIAISTSTGSNTTIALGLSYSVVSSLALLLVGKARTDALVQRLNGSVIYSASGLLTQPARPTGSSATDPTTLLRDVSASALLCTAIAALTMESPWFTSVLEPEVSNQIFWEIWIIFGAVLSVVYGLMMIVVYMVADGALILMTLRHGSFATSLAPLFAAVVAQLALSFSASRLWFATLCAGSAFLYFGDTVLPGGTYRHKIRLSKIFTTISFLSFAGLVMWYIRQSYAHPGFSVHPSHKITADSDYAPVLEPLAPLQFSNKRVHPMDQLMRDANDNWDRTLHSQSQTLEAAVTEYKRRYGMHPPPNFHIWFEYARSKNVQLIDEYDTIYHLLLPFWGLSPATIRSRAREALGFGGNFLIGLLIRDGQVKHADGGPEWQQDATVGMMKSFVQFLPDMDLAFNIHDEPRVVVPHDDLSQLIQLALDQNIPRAFKRTPRNSFTARPKDINDGRRIDEVKTTRFNVFAHQPTWISSRLSCPPASAARNLEESLATDNLTAYALGELGFVYNHTAFSDICNSPSFATSHGFFDRPNAFNVVHDLFPIFSQSKMSCFQDILYPSPWYWYEKVSYDESKAVEWNQKESRLWWRGSTTGGFSRDGGWRRQHRQQFVRKVNALDQAKILANSHSDDREATPEWAVKEVPRQDFNEIMDVHFTHVGQCDPGDCDAQHEFFNVVEPVDMQEAWRFKYLLDLDGNAFSGRFYAFLKSTSMTFKMAVFREWHEEWIRPWVHYVPLSLRAVEALETVRYFANEEQGQQQARKMAESSSSWTNAALRNEDFEVWFFRLLLEYGRLVDDDRDSIGFAGS